jgi:hypothetical protein
MEFHSREWSSGPPINQVCQCFEPVEAARGKPRTGPSAYRGQSLRSEQAPSRVIDHGPPVAAGQAASKEARGLSRFCFSINWRAA